MLSKPQQNRIPKQLICRTCVIPVKIGFEFVIVLVVNTLTVEGFSKSFWDYSHAIHCYFQDIGNQDKNERNEQIHGPDRPPLFSLAVC